MGKKAKRVERNPLVMAVAAVIWLGGLALVILGGLHIAVFGWWALTIIAGGLSSMSLATATIVTGKPEWILLDLLIPG